MCELVHRGSPCAAAASPISAAVRPVTSSRPPSPAGANVTPGPDNRLGPARSRAGNGRVRPSRRACRTNSSTRMSVINRPRPITITCSAVSAISLIRCEETKTVRPSAASVFEQGCRSSECPPGSRPFTGSSSISVSRITEQRGRDAEPLAHAERELSGPLRAATSCKTDQVDQLVDAALRRCRASAASASRWLQAERPVCTDARLEQGTDLVQRGRDARDTACRSRVTLPAVGAIQTEDQPHRRRFAGAIRPEKPGHHSGLHLECQSVDGALVAVILRRFCASITDATVPATSVKWR